MHVSVTRLGAATYLTPRGPLGDEGLVALGRTADEVWAGGATDIVIDLGHCPTLDSRAIEALLDLGDRAAVLGGSVRLVTSEALTRTILAVTRVDAALPVFSSVEDAGRSFL